LPAETANSPVIALRSVLSLVPLRESSVRSAVGVSHLNHIHHSFKLTLLVAGHFAKDCPQGGGSGECRNCGKEGHRAKDCTEERKIICRNCDEEGHVGKDCPKPRDCKSLSCHCLSLF